MPAVIDPRRSLTASALCALAALCLLVALSGCVAVRAAPCETIVWKVVSRNTDGSVTYTDGCNTMTCRGSACSTTLLYCGGLR